VLKSYICFWLDFIKLLLIAGHTKLPIISMRNTSTACSRNSANVIIATWLGFFQWMKISFVRVCNNDEDISFRRPLLMQKIVQNTFLGFSSIMSSRTKSSEILFAKIWSLNSSVLIMRKHSLKVLEGKIDFLLCLLTIRVGWIL